MRRFKRNLLLWNITWNIPGLSCKEKTIQKGGGICTTEYICWVNLVPDPRLICEYDLSCPPAQPTLEFTVPVNSSPPEVIYNLTIYEQITNLIVYHKMCRHVWIFPEPYETIPHVGWRCCSWKRRLHTYCSTQAITDSSTCMQRGSRAADLLFNWLFTAGA